MSARGDGFEMEWENVPGSVKGIVRARTPGGWIVAAVAPGGGVVSVSYMADKNHTWLKPKSD